MHFRIDGALNPWIDQLHSALLEMYPLLDGVVPATPSDLPPPRVTMTLKDDTDSSIPDPLSLDKQHHMAKLRYNRRITSPDWYQDVRHLELSFDDEIRCGASLHPKSSEVIGSVTTLGTSRLSTRKFHLKTSTLSYQRWVGRTSPIPYIPLIFHCEVSSGRSDGYYTRRRTSRSNVSRSPPTLRYVEDDFH